MAFELSEFIDTDIVGVVTGQSVDLPMDDLLDPLNLPFDVIDPIKVELANRHDDAVRAAFAAGLACGLKPELVLLKEVLR